MNGNFEIKDGEYTSTIYTLIKEQRYVEAINILNYIYDSNPTSRAALSLLAYCYYYMQDYVNAANCYEQLSHHHPDQEDYRVYYAQSLYAATLYEEAMKVTVTVESAEHQGSMLKLQAAIRYTALNLAYFTLTGTVRKTLLEQNLWWTSVPPTTRTPRSTWPACCTRRGGTARRWPSSARPSR